MTQYICVLTAIFVHACPVNVYVWVGVIVWFKAELYMNVHPRVE